MSQKNIMMMAVAAGSATTEGTPRKFYTGVAPVYVLAMNPDKKTLKEFTGYEPAEEPVYTGVMKDKEGKEVNYARFTFLVQPTEDVMPDAPVFQLTYFIRNAYVFGSNTGKYQVVDEYGRTAWATEDVIKAKAKIMYKDGTMEANVTQNYRPIYDGEEALNYFLTAFLNIKKPVVRDANGNYNMRPASELGECECRLDHIADLFSNNFSEIKPSIEAWIAKRNKIRVLFGTRTDNQGQIRQDVYSGMVLKVGNTSYNKLEEDVNSHGYSGRLYDFTEFHEIVNMPTDMSQAPATTAPASAPATPKFPFGPKQ